MADEVISYEEFDYHPSWPDGTHEYHDPSSVKLGELVQAGWFDLSDKVTWHWPMYDESQDEILRNKIVNRFWDRGLGVLPPGLWKRQFLEKMTEIMPKYIMMYKVRDESGLIPGNTSEYYKARNIFSDFPQTQLGGNSDYASTGNDTEYERIRQEDMIEVMDRMQSYRDVDEMILDDLEELFSCLISVSLNTR